MRILDATDNRWRALDLFCGAGGVSVGLARAGFDVTGVDSNPKCAKYWRRGMEPYGGEFLAADALEVPLDGYDLIAASPPCQAYTALRHLCKGKTYPDLVDVVRGRLASSGALWVIENVPDAPLAVPPGGSLVLLCGTMFGLATPDGRAEIRRHRLFETSFGVPLRPACQHGHAPESMSVTGTGMGVGGKTRWRERQTLVVTGHGYQGADAHSRRKVLCVAGGKAMSGGMMTPQGELKRRARSDGIGMSLRETFPIEIAQAAMGIPWMPMKYLSQAIPPIYATWLGRQALDALGWPLDADGAPVDFGHERRCGTSASPGL